jgi:geranylgeranyl diphosphate synthase type II
MAFSEKEDAAQLQHLFTLQLEDNETKIESVKIFSIIQDIKSESRCNQEYTFKAFETLEK